MKTIYKYTLKGMHCIIDIREDCEFLHVGLDANEDICIWAMVNTNLSTKYFKFIIYGTGEDLKNLPSDYQHLGTVNKDGEIWHIFGGVVK